MDSFKKGWFSEVGTVHEYTVSSMKVKKILFHEKSKYQDILIFDSAVFGRVLVLDDVVQVTERDEFFYHELAANLPLNSHPNPKKVLVVGGGDGGTVREVAKHPRVESITLCEIDQLVTDACEKYLPFTAKGFESKKLTVYAGDGAEFMKNHKEEFDVIINDSSDPKGPGLNLFSQSFYKSLRQALKPGGILLAQGEGYWYDLPLIKEVVSFAKTLFPVVDYSVAYIGSYPGGHLGFILCSTTPNTNFRDPMHKLSPKAVEEMNLKYYTPDMHRASMALPLFVAEELGLKWQLS